MISNIKYSNDIYYNKNMNTIAKVISTIINNTILNFFSLLDLNNEKIEPYNKIEPDNINCKNSSITLRVFECVLCNSKKHSITKCSKYRELKKNLEKKNYLKFNSNELNESEECGFCASGIIPYVCVGNIVYLLVLEESRNKIPGLNFIGGKRECVLSDDTNEIRPETSYETALNELKEELGEILTKKSMDMIIKQITKCKIPNFVFWSGDSKMCLYGIKFPNNFLFSLTLNDVDKSNTEAQGFKWIRYNGLGYMEKQNSNIYELHKYSKSMLNSMKKLSSDNNLNNLFV